VQATIGDAMPQSLSPAGRYYRPELDVVRCCAFAMVFAYHVMPVTAHAARAYLALRATGASGIELFFTLSAYLIAELMQRERTRTGSFDVAAFYARRALRIWPLYGCALLAAILVARAAGHPLPATTIAAYAFMLGNWDVVARGFLAYGFGPLWTISVEEQFYLVWPLVARCASPGALRAGCVAAWCASQLAVAVLCVRHAPIIPALWANSLTYIQYFALGALASLTLHGRSARLPGAIRYAVIAAGVAVMYGANVLLVASAHAGPGATLGLTFPAYATVGLGAVLVLIGTVGARVPPALAPLVRLGKISYGLYLLHLPCIELVTRLLGGAARPATIAPLALGLTIALAHLSYRYVESPFLHVKRRFEVVASRPV